MKTRKRFTMTVTVSVPITMSASEARREVKTLITHQINCSANYGDVKACSVKASKRVAS